ncbi:intracellular growth attenuator family protein [Escherichia coli]|nr:intracellular growth attenuator family protein [Escherichia coli]
MPDRSGLWRYLSTTLLLLTMLGSAIYNGVQAGVVTSVIALA